MNHISPRNSEGQSGPVGGGAMHMHTYIHSTLVLLNIEVETRFRWVQLDLRGWGRASHTIYGGGLRRPTPLPTGGQASIVEDLHT